MKNSVSWNQIIQVETAYELIKTRKQDQHRYGSEDGKNTQSFSPFCKYHLHY